MKVVVVNTDNGARIEVYESVELAIAANARNRGPWVWTEHEVQTWESARESCIVPKASVGIYPSIPGKPEPEPEAFAIIMT